MKWLIIFIVFLMLLSIACGGGGNCTTTIINNGDGNTATTYCETHNSQSSGGPDIIGMSFAVFGFVAFIGISLLVVVNAVSSGGVDY